MKMRCRNFAATLGVFTIAVASILTPSAAHATVSGTVECTNGAAIQGIWVEAADPAKRGWANRWSIGGSSSRNGWSHAALNSGDSYQLHVGCGNWSPAYKSTQTNGHSGDFLCIRKAQGIEYVCWGARATVKSNSCSGTSLYTKDIMI